VRLVSFITRIYDDARSSERQRLNLVYQELGRISVHLNIEFHRPLSYYVTCFSAAFFDIDFVRMSHKVVQPYPLHDTRVFVHS